MIYKFGERLTEISQEEWEKEKCPAVFLTDSNHAEETLAIAGIVYEAEIQIAKIGFCKIENQQECMVGTFCIPKLLDVLGSRYRMYMFVNENNVVIVDDETFSERLINRIKRKRMHQGETKERFLYNYIAEFMSRDLEILVAYERRLLRMEEDVSQDHTDTIQNRLMPIRRELLNLRSYYDEMMDLTKELEENENGLFLNDQLKYFGTLTDRADRLMSRTSHLLEYARQVKEAYQSQIDNRQNNNMQFLTVISTIFFPLTLITGWFGMNFKDMPGLENGYPAVMALSIVIIVICILILKKKKII
ncbi:MAG: CorA family divalent cation transporter [Mediterraneibacter sp.]|nr:CorA family divalent cation transporter [Mediterraneibacter sp.]